MSTFCPILCPDIASIACFASSSFSNLTNLHMWIMNMGKGKNGCNERYEEGRVCTQIRDSHWSLDQASLLQKGWNQKKRRESEAAHHQSRVEGT